MDQAFTCWRRSMTPSAQRRSTARPTSVGSTSNRSRHSRHTASTTATEAMNADEPVAAFAHAAAPPLLPTSAPCGARFNTRTMAASTNCARHAKSCDAAEASPRELVPSRTCQSHASIIVAYGQFHFKFYFQHCNLVHDERAWTGTEKYFVEVKWLNCSFDTKVLAHG